MVLVVVGLCLIRLSHYWYQFFNSVVVLLLVLVILFLSVAVGLDILLLVVVVSVDIILSLLGQIHSLFK